MFNFIRTFPKIKSWKGICYFKLFKSYKYIPVVFKLGHRTTKEHLFDLAFCSILLEPFQKSKIEKGFVISDYSNRINYEKIDLNEQLRKKVLNIFLNLNEYLKGSIPEITEDRKNAQYVHGKSFAMQKQKIMDTLLK